MQGWISLYRKIQENFLWKEFRKFSRAEAWIDILMEVRHSKEPDKVMIKNTVIICSRGQSLNSLETWADRWNWTKSATRRFLTLLKRQKMIFIENMQITTRLSVCNYETYQDMRNTSETQVKRKRNASETQVAPDNNGKNANNGNNEKKTIINSGEFVEYWNSKNRLPRIKDFNNSRKQQLKTRSGEDVFRENWRPILDKLDASSFHTGGGPNGWVANVNWILKNDKNYMKIWESENGRETIPTGQRQFNQTGTSGNTDSRTLKRPFIR